MTQLQKGVGSLQANLPNTDPETVPPGLQVGSDPQDCERVGIPVPPQWMGPQNLIPS